MRADEPIDYRNVPNELRCVEPLADYINQLRYERLMTKAIHFNDMYWKYTWIAGSDCESAIKSKRIAEALEARAKRIKEGM